MSSATDTTVHDPFEIEVTAGKFEPRENCPTGPNGATIIGLFDLGHQKDTDQQNQEIEKRKLMIVFETVRRDSKGDPFRFAKIVNWSMHETSSLYGLVKNVTGKALAEGEKFNPRALLGQPCTLNITHKEVGEGEKKRVYDNLESVAGWSATDDEGNPKKRPEPRVSPLAWSVMQGTPLPALPWVPRYYGETLVDQVEQSAEYKAGKVTISPEARTAVGNGKKRAAAPAEGASDDEIPF